MVKLGISKDIALRRLHGTERRLARDNNLREHYVEFMQEYLRLGHMKKIEDMIQGSVKRCFLPHHPVVKEDSTTTKVRVVFDASCPTSSGISLNDTLLSGLVIQEDLRSIILRSRTKQIMLVADVEKMFRQIYIVPEERPLQSILWRFSESEEIGIYELSTITYGIKPAPFLATRTLKQFSLDEGELERAELIWIRRVQQEVFPEELKAVAKGDAVPRRSPLRWFNPYISADNILKVGGRLRHSNEAEDTKHPSVLPARHTLTRLILKQYHERLLHAGPQLMMSAVRLRYWPLGGRNVAREIVHKCVKCFRSKPTLAQQFMGELPAARVRVSRPFLHSGVDYFGPVYIRPGPRRQSHKAYVAVFICLCTKAVHLELVSDLTTDRFIQALRRFVARRGKCSNLYSDNGTNFVGARNKLKELLIMLKDQQHREQVSKVCADEGMRWHFNPPSAPHFGGLWEAAVRSAKHHLLRVIGENPVSLEDMNTLLIQVEACLNSRPLTPNDLEPLTPANFLVGESLQAIPEPNLEEIPLNRLNQWQLIQRRLQTFWSRWRKEYLSQLQARTKRWRPAIKIEVGKLVIIKDDNLPPMRWKLGRIIEVHPGADGIVRVVTLKTANGNLKRPVEKICILPV
ncbi:uncharacterized protein LOC129773443 [Toxorhynchites rutilus septentrionalis]|uniref:uncharacterized protein LOC129773443 n=1 Tax=Toxorhynchites rutilus septentrionalis TaxID=329112 RepID=UPI002479E01D|nr:uncharacterized protein LOC129773443 [Toxorhynchites rutilus septentrionalis]